MAIYANLQVDQGTDFYSVITVEGSDGSVFTLNGYSVSGQVRKTYNSITSYSLNAVITNAGAGQITISLNSSQTASMRSGRYVYDVQVSDSQNNVTRVVEGQVEINPRVTRE